MKIEKEIKPSPILFPSQRATLDMLISASTKLRSGQTIVVYGLPGTGKTAIFSELKKHTPLSMGDFGETRSASKSIYSVTGIEIPEALIDTSPQIIWHPGFNTDEMVQLLSVADQEKILKTDTGRALLDTYSLGSFTLTQNIVNDLRFLSMPDSILKNVSYFIEPYLRHLLGHSLDTLPSKEVDAILKKLWKKRNIKTQRNDKLYTDLINRIVGIDRRTGIMEYVLSGNEQIRLGEIRYGAQQLVPLSTDGLTIIQNFVAFETQQTKRRNEPRVYGLASIPKSHERTLQQFVGKLIYEATGKYTRKTAIAIGNWEKGTTAPCTSSYARFDSQAENAIDFYLSDYLGHDRRKRFIQKGVGGKESQVLFYIAGDHSEVVYYNILGMCAFLTLCENFGYNCYLSLDVEDGGQAFFYNASDKTYTPEHIPLR